MSDQMSAEVRSTFIGASESSQVVGLSPFGDISELYNRKKGLNSGPRTTEAMNRGNRQEEFVANEVAAYLGEGVEIRAKQLRVLHPEKQWLGATLDGIAYRGVECLGITEFKTIGTYLWATPPDYYRCQVVHQMYVTGIKTGYLCAWSTKETKMKVWEFKLDEQMEFWEPILAECERFWNENILKDVPPPPKPRKERTWSDLPSALLDRYLDLGDTAKMLEDERDTIKRQIFDALGNPEESVSLEGDAYKVDIKKVETTRVNTKKLPPDIAEAAKEKGISYRLTVARTNIKAFGS